MEDTLAHAAVLRIGGGSSADRAVCAVIVDCCAIAAAIAHTAWRVRSTNPLRVAVRSTTSAAARAMLTAVLPISSLACRVVVASC